MPNRKWPFRKHSKLENSIKSLKAWQKRGHNVTDNLEQLYRERAENVTPAIMYYYEKDIVIPGVGVDDPSITGNNNIENSTALSGTPTDATTTTTTTTTMATTTTTTTTSPLRGNTPSPPSKERTTSSGSATGKHRKRFLPEETR